MDSLAVFRKGVGDDLTELARQHYKHDLQQEDRDKIKSASVRVSRYASVGSVIGLGLGVLLALRLRRTRARYFEAFRAAERPESVVFAGGRTEKIPDITSMLRPTTIGDIATYGFLSTAGIVIGGETGLLAGMTSASKTITQDPESRDRIDKAFRTFKADALRRQADELDGGKGILFE